MKDRRILLPLVAAVAMLLASCANRKVSEQTTSHIDSLIFDVGTQKDYPRMLELADSFELTGGISALDANRWRGVAYYRQGQYRMAEICYRKALECDVKSEQDQVSYNKSARRLSELLLVRGDYEGSLRVAVPAVAKMEASGIGSDIDYAILLNNIGCCQLNLGQDKEANESFITARGHYASRWQSDKTSRGFQEAVIGTVYTSQAYINTRRYAESIYWIDRTEMLLNMYRQRSDARSEYFDEYQGRIEIMRAVALQRLNKPAEAAEAYQRFLETDFSKTGAGRINANDYLVVAERYKEAADNYRYLDQTLSKWGMEVTLDNIQLYMLPKYHANVKAGRRDSARVIGARILSLLDSTITSQKNSSMAELATIYDTNQKEAQIAKQRADMTRLQFISMGIALVLIIVFLLVYTFHKRKAQHRLAAAHQKLEEAHGKLKSAYDQLEETTKAKERIESELRIARDIQDSLVPNEYPVYKGLDIYASMTPARFIGGDLYDFLLEDNHLFFSLGDVSGKGIPASLFMAQAARLFRALAKEGFRPSDIATRLNAELTEGNERGMFVTMFLGYVNLDTGHLVYCNAGHNPPVLDGQFLEIESNAPVGLWPELVFEGGEIKSIKGKRFFLYSDGLNEAEDRDQHQFGDDRLLEVLNSMPTASCRQVIETMTAEVEKHRHGADPNDDLTMLCLRVE